MTATIATELRALLTSDSALRGLTTVHALRLLRSPPVVAAFREAADGLVPAEEVLEVVELALVVRLAVAARWDRAGCSALERRAAEECDRALEPHSGALTALDNAEQWVEDFYMDALLDYNAWWGYLASPRYALAGEAIEAWLRDLDAARQPPRQPPVWEVNAEEDERDRWSWCRDAIENERHALADWVCELRDPHYPWEHLWGWPSRSIDWSRVDDEPSEWGVELRDDSALEWNFVE
jgi:hypothetical protein